MPPVGAALAPPEPEAPVPLRPGGAAAPPEDGAPGAVPVVVDPAPLAVDGVVAADPPLAGVEDTFGPDPVVAGFVAPDVVSVAPDGAGGEELRGSVRGGADRGSS